MGADFIGAVCPITRTKDQAITAIDTLHYEDVINVVNEWAILDLLYDEAKEYVIEALADVYYAYLEGDRECTTWTFGGIDHLITGGMSAGDPPTDIYTAVGIISALGITYDRLPIEATDLADLLDEHGDSGADTVMELSLLVERYGGWKTCDNGHDVYSAAKTTCPQCEADVEAEAVEDYRKRDEGDDEPDIVEPHDA